MNTIYTYEEWHPKWIAFLKKHKLTQGDMSKVLLYDTANRLSVTISKNKAKGLFPFHLVRLMIFDEYLEKKYKKKK